MARVILTGRELRHGAPFPWHLACAYRADGIARGCCWVSGAILLLGSCSPHHRPLTALDCAGLERESGPRVSREVNLHDAQLILPLFEGMTCPVGDCEGLQLLMARSRASRLDLLDEPMVLSQVDVAYRLLLSGMG